MSYTVTNVTANAVSAGSLKLSAYESKVVDYIDSAILTAVSSGYLSITGYSASTVGGTNDVLTDSTGGTASLTLAVIADAATANAIASLAAIVNKHSVQLNNTNAIVSSIDEQVNQ